jgi:DNA-binding LacI/PurR family transcriptional regulator
MPERQVLRVYQNPHRSKPSTLARVARAARELGFRVPVGSGAA